MTMSDAAQLSEPPNNWEMFRKWVQFCQDVSTNSGARYLGYQLRLSYDIKEWRLHLETIKPGTNWLKISQGGALGQPIRRWNILKYRYEWGKWVEMLQYVHQYRPDRARERPIQY